MRSWLSSGRVVAVGMVVGVVGSGAVDVAELLQLAKPMASVANSGDHRRDRLARCIAGSVRDRQNRRMTTATELLYLDDAYLTEFEATVIAVRDDAVALDRTVFYPTGGGQPHDVGILGGHVVVSVRKEDDGVWHSFAGPHDLAVGSVVAGSIDFERRHQLMRTHTALHVLCGVIWNEWHVPVTGGNMEPLSARMDFAFDPLPDGFGARVEQLVNDELDADRPIVVSYLDPSQTVGDDLIRTRENRVPDSVTSVRLVDIVGLDQQADGGTHVRSTGEVGRVKVVKTENKGKGNKRIRLEVLDR